MDWVFFGPTCCSHCACWLQRLQINASPSGLTPFVLCHPGETAVSGESTLLLFPQSRAALGYRLSPAAGDSGLARFVLFTVTLTDLLQPGRGPELHHHHHSSSAGIGISHNV